MSSIEKEQTIWSQVFVHYKSIKLSGNSSIENLFMVVIFRDYVIKLMHLIII